MKALFFVFLEETEAITWKITPTTANTIKAIENTRINRYFLVIADAADGELLMETIPRELARAHLATKADE